MKFHQLPIGSHFSYQQKRYCKTAPLAATAEDGSQRMIPRAAVVAAAEQRSGTQCSPAERSPLLDTLQAHHRRNLELFEEATASLPEVQRQTLRKQLEDNYRDLLDRLPEAD